MTGRVSSGEPPVGLTALATGLAGFAGMGMTMVWLHHLGALLGNDRRVYATILVVIVVGMGLGAVAGGALQRRVGQAVVSFVAVQALFVGASLAALADTGPSGVVAERASLWASLGLVLRELGVPALMMGATFPLARAIVRDTNHAAGRWTGLLYLTSAVGAVAGLLAVGFGLLPRLGMQHTVSALAALVAFGAVPLALTVLRQPKQPLARLVLGAALLGLALTLSWWARRPAG